MDVLAACLGRTTQLPANPEKEDSLSPVQTERRDMGTFPLGHASSTSMCRSVADFPVGSRSQWEDTHITAWLQWILKIKIVLRSRHFT